MIWDAVPVGRHPPQFRGGDSNAAGSKAQLRGRVSRCGATLVVGWSTITSAQSVSEFALPTSSSTPAGIAAGSDGALWFTEFFGNKIGRITTSGLITEFPIPTLPSAPVGIAVGRTAPCGSSNCPATRSGASQSMA
jgi:streptogramin lyase